MARARTNRHSRNSSAQDVVDLFCEHFSQKRERRELARVASFGNSFEGWLKWELALAACERWGCRPWESQKNDAKWRSIGVEYKASLNSLRANRIRARKAIDLWVCPRGDKHVYVELKVAFANGNTGKQLASARDDLACLHAVDRKDLAGCAVILVAVGFGSDALKALKKEGATVEELAPARGKGPDETPSVTLVSFVA